MFKHYLKKIIIVKIESNHNVNIMLMVAGIVKTAVSSNFFAIVAVKNEMCN